MRWHKPVFILFLVSFAVSWTRLWLDPSSTASWLDGGLFCAGALTALLGLARRLPMQNVLMAGALIALMATIVTTIGALSGVPFGPLIFTERLGWRIFGEVPWPLPLLWIVVIVSGRGVARLIVRPWRRTNFYGFWVIGLTCLLAVLMDVGLEPFAVKVRGYWWWRTPPSVLAWHNAPWVNFPGWFSTALGMLAFTMPWLINKRPVKQPRDYHPLIVWLLFNLYFVTGNALKGLWWAAGIGLCLCVVTASYAIRGARW